MNIKQELEEIKSMFYFVALATEKKRLQLDQLKALNVSGKDNNNGSH